MTAEKSPPAVLKMASDIFEELAKHSFDKTSLDSYFELGIRARDKADKVLGRLDELKEKYKKIKPENEKTSIDDAVISHMMNLELE